jgi:hypothetical protein
MTISKNLILQLYKSLYKYGQQLKYTDKDYYFKSIRKQFERYFNFQESFFFASKSLICSLFSSDYSNNSEKIETLYKVSFEYTT